MATDEDRALQAFLARRSSLNERYAELSAAESDAPPAALDAAILKAARDGVAMPVANAETESYAASAADSQSRKPSRLRSRVIGPFGQRWMAPLGLAAVVVLSVSIVTLLPSPQEDEFNAPNVIHRGLLSVRPGTRTRGAASLREADRLSTESPANPAAMLIVEPLMAEPPADLSPSAPPPRLIGQRRKQSANSEHDRALGAPKEAQVHRLETQRQAPEQRPAPISTSKSLPEPQLGSQLTPSPPSFLEPGNVPEETEATASAPQRLPQPSPSSARDGIIPASPEATSGRDRLDQSSNHFHKGPTARLGGSNQAVAPDLGEGRASDEKALSRGRAVAPAVADKVSPATPNSPVPHDAQTDNQRFDAAIVRIRAYVSAGLDADGLRGIRELRRQFPSRKLPSDLEDFARKTR